MSESGRQGTWGFDAAVDGAWRHFREVLADTMETLRDGRIPLFIKQRDEAVRRHFVAVRRSGDEVVVWVASNSTVAPDQRLSRSTLTELRRLGLARTTAKGYTATIPMSHVDEAAALVVRVLREVLGIVHPSMLVSRDRALTPDAPAGLVQRWGNAIVRPRNADHLRAVVAATIASETGDEPGRDEDGDLVVRRGPVVAWVRCSRGEPMIHIFAHLVLEVSDPAAAQAEVTRLAQETPLLKFVLVEDAIYVLADLPASPFVPDHLRTTLRRVLGLTAEEMERVAAKVGGRTFGTRPTSHEAQTEPDRDETAARIHPVMLRFLQLDALEEGSVDAHAMARLCHHDDDLILDLIRWNEEQEIEWMEAHDDALHRGEQAEADACERERAHAARTVRLLRQTLHLVLLGESA